MNEIETIFTRPDNTGRHHHELTVNPKTGELYWNKKKIVTEQKLNLAWWVNIAIVLGAMSTAIIAFLDLFRFIGK
jgi:hypothetical protein